MGAAAGKDALYAELVGLEEEELSLSGRRRRLHDRIDFLRGNGGTSGDLDSLQESELNLSARRREVHARIDELRGLLGGSPGRPHSPRLLD